MRARSADMPYNRRMPPQESSDRKDNNASRAGLSAAEYRDILASAPRIVVVGCTGSGKTTVARTLAKLLDVPHVELDSHNWEPDWTAAQTDVFRQRVSDALSSDAWVVDGNYSAVRDLVWPRAALLVWLNLPYRVVLWRLLWRTLRRVFKREELWNGNREEFRTQFLSTDSLFRWQAGTFRRLRVSIPQSLEQPEHAHLEVVVLRSGAEVRRWLAALGGALRQQ